MIGSIDDRWLDLIKLSIHSEKMRSFFAGMMNIKLFVRSIVFFVIVFRLDFID